MLRTCDECGRRVEALALGPGKLIALCDLCAWTQQQKHAKREQQGGSPPPEAYREVRLPENWTYPRVS